MKGSTIVIVIALCILGLIFSARARNLKSKTNQKHIDAERIEHDFKKFVEELKTFIARPDLQTVRNARSLVSKIKNIVATVAKLIIDKLPLDLMHDVESWEKDPTITNAGNILMTNLALSGIFY